MVNKKNLILTLLVGFLLGALWLVTIRFFTYHSDTVHHHANFALYINGQREKFDNFTYYEEVQACGGDEVNNARTRVHLHDKVNSVVHVHDHAATWSHFFTNLGFSLANDMIKTEDGLYVDGKNGNQLTFVINGQKTGAVANRTISSEDSLLISYGKESDGELTRRYDAITKDAAEYNKRNDPSSCSGGHPASFSDRLKHAFGIN